jgi:proteasome lid subunit RPN8/RPN11
MVFGDVAYREPRRLRRPDRDRKYACLAYQVPGADDMPIFLDREVADRIERHALSDTSVELGGILLGHECVDDQTGQPFVWISRELEARHYENTQASFTYTHESWEEITRERDKRFPDLDIVGWYHTHPDFGIFLSGHDQFIHNHFFAQPLQVAYVVDPIRRTRGFFVWKGGKLVEVGGYHIVSPREERPRLARVVDDLEGIEPNEESGGAGITLTPRLEAELMSMLRRTAAPMSYSAPPDRGVTAAVFTLIGLVGGSLGLALALWIGSLTIQIREQTAQMAGLRQNLVDAKRLADLDERAAAVAASEEALSAVLQEVRIDGSPERFVELYQRSVRERDQATARAAMADQVGHDLLAKNDEILQLTAERDKLAVAAKAATAKLAAISKAAPEGKEGAVGSTAKGFLDGFSPAAQGGMLLVTSLFGLLVGWLLPRRPLLPLADPMPGRPDPPANPGWPAKPGGEEIRIGGD